MNQGEILILNPFGQNHANVILETIDTKTQYGFKYFEDYNLQLALLQQNTRLIFVLAKAPYDSNEEALLEKLLVRFSGLPIIVIVELESENFNFSCIQKYAWNVIASPVTQNDILLNICYYLNSSNYGGSLPIASQSKEYLGLDLIKGKSKHVLAIKEKILQIASYDVPVLITGETGTGKELVAQALHHMSHRSKGALVAVNCGAIPTELFENELFGHRKGAYTHASESQAGLVQDAERGTLFLDEVESMSVFAQVKLLRFLEEKKYKPLGQAKFVRTDVRIIAASNQNLRELVLGNKFREDLLYRLSGFNIELLPLRQRSEDIPILTEYFIKRYSTLFKKEIKGISPPAMLKFIHYDWPGNVRELENLIRRIIITCKDEWIWLQEIQNDELMRNKINHINPPTLLPLRQAKKELIESFEKKYAEDLMRVCHGNISRASRFAKKERSSFCRLLKKYHIDPETYRELIYP